MAYAIIHDAKVWDPYSDTYTLSLTPSNTVVETVVTPLIPRVNPILQTYPHVRKIYDVTTLYPTYYDSGIGKNPLAQYETNDEVRKIFLDKWLHKYFPNLLRMLKVENGHVKVLSPEEAKTNDISNDTESDYYKKRDFIGFEILSLSKNRKVMIAIIKKTGMKWYDLLHNKHYVAKQIAKYVEKKLKEMQNTK